MLSIIYHTIIMRTPIVFFQIKFEVKLKVYYQKVSIKDINDNCYLNIK